MRPCHDSECKRAKEPPGASSWEALYSCAADPFDSKSGTGAVLGAGATWAPQDGNRNHQGFQAVLSFGVGFDSRRLHHSSAPGSRTTDVEAPDRDRATHRAADLEPAGDRQDLGPSCDGHAAPLPAGDPPGEACPSRLAASPGLFRRSPRRAWTAKQMRATHPAEKPPRTRVRFPPGVHRALLDGDLA
jgi:hypothetical protein